MHPLVEQTYIVTDFLTLVHSYIQVTPRLIDYILFVMALVASMWKQLVKVLQLKYPTISYTNKLYEGNKEILLTQNIAASYKPRFSQEIIAKLLYDDNSNAT